MSNDIGRRASGFLSIQRAQSKISKSKSYLLTPSSSKKRRKTKRPARTKQGRQQKNVCVFFFHQSMDDGRRRRRCCCRLSVSPLFSSLPPPPRSPSLSLTLMMMNGRPYSSNARDMANDACFFFFLPFFFSKRQTKKTKARVREERKTKHWKSSGLSRLIVHIFFSFFSLFARGKNCSLPRSRLQGKKWRGTVEASAVETAAA